MKLTWLGHSCFLVEEKGYRILMDPYTDVTGHTDIQTSGHQVLCSHQHFDHNAVDGVKLLPEQPCPFAIRTVETWHDDQGGALRGSNTIHILSASGVTVAHLGDLGHQLTEEQLAAIGQVDGLLIPVGGTYTVDAIGAKRICDAIQPKWVTPMHYRHGAYGFPVLDEVEQFLALWPAEQITRLNGPELIPPQSGVVVLQFGA